MASSFASKLPGFGGSKAHSEKDDETSLTTLLSTDQCANLTFLIATITATMRKSLLDTFTAEEMPSSSIPTTKAKQESAEAVDGKQDDADVEKEKARLKKEQAEREAEARKELAKPETQELKKAMLKYFDEWRGKVIGRVGEIVNSREEAKEQSSQVKESDVSMALKRQSTETKSISEVENNEQDEDAVFRKLYPPFQTSLVQLEESKRALILHSLLLILLSLVSALCGKRQTGYVLTLFSGALLGTLPRLTPPPCQLPTHQPLHL
jgi:hypothetical protein